MNMRDRVNQAYKGKTGQRAEEDPAGTKLPTRTESPRGGPVPKGSSAPAEPAKRSQPGQAPSKRAMAKAEGKTENLLKTGEERGIAKAAKFLLLLGTDEASKILAHLSPEEVEAISKEIIKVRNIDAIEANDILAEFGWLVKTQGYSIEGGAETAKAMLEAAFGPERAGALLRKAAPETTRPFRFLEGFEPKELQIILKEEPPLVLAVVLPYLSPKKASGLVERLPDEVRLEVIKRVAKLDKVSPEVLRKVEEGLKERIRKVGTVTTEEIDGKSALASILRHVDPRLEESVLEALDDENPELSRSVRERLFTLEDVVRVPDRDLQKMLRDFQDRDLALLLKGRNDSFKDKILDNVSQNRRTLILDESSFLGKVKREDADAAAREFIGILKAAWESGDIVLEGDDDLVG